MAVIQGMRVHVSGWWYCVSASMMYGVCPLGAVPMVAWTGEEKVQSFPNGVLKIGLPCVCVFVCVCTCT